ncbi:hypothetical protein BAUCODRAFT_36298 [Baudoinia panamericana UAMH 10762]|uniref:Apple domain-containing protein n=1 Tax=Baudoinia panamericana (strain UAMH 10762) TaxID=717646 RepID=M2LI28_BAUPA|nr:uncharacterized protein BAUCODRAFT_36298 [Baudoinia panamericana UAMH 10762]EMC93837.1 hypothetical protein BAUCODRAFT_36298 [Baudoinia panamericana UAMH 10762]
MSTLTQLIVPITTLTSYETSVVTGSTTITPTTTMSTPAGFTPLPSAVAAANETPGKKGRREAEKLEHRLALERRASSSAGSSLKPSSSTFTSVKSTSSAGSSAKPTSSAGSSAKPSSSFFTSAKSTSVGSSATVTTATPSSSFYSSSITSPATSYPTQVECWSTQTIILQYVTNSTLKSTVTVTSQSTSTKSTTTTITNTFTSTPADASSTVTAFTSTTLTSTSTVSVTSTTTYSNISTAFAAQQTYYPICDVSNQLQYINGVPASEIDWVGGISIYTGSGSSAYDCCVECYNNPLCGVAAFEPIPDPTTGFQDCVYGMISSQDRCYGGNIVGKLVTHSNTDPFVVMNGACGQYSF